MTLDVWGTEEGGLLRFEASRKLDSKCLEKRGRLTLGVWVSAESGIYGYEALVANEKRIPNELPKGSHSTPWL